ncbi:AraC family transcriptional regulator [Alloalcanivorax xenomutans]|uniref:AraC family transcriptional regulator n=1 Tax=Alloalcanivorax xenomutans TaxID=1094342 RepID=UPI003A80DB79
MVTLGRAWFDAGIPGIYVVLLCDVMKGLGKDPAALLGGVGESREQLLAPQSRVPLELAQRCAEQALDMAGSAGLGFRYARAMRITLHGPVGLLALSSATLGDGLDAARRYLGLRAPFWHMDRREENGRVIFPLVANADPRRIHAFVVEAMLVGFIHMLEQLLEAVPEGAQLHFRQPPPPHAMALRGDVPVPVRFNQDEDALVLPRALLSVAPLLADPQTAALAREQCEAEVSRWRSEQEGPLAERVRVVLRDTPAPLPDLAAMAERMAVSARTLKRHLQQAGSSYRQVQDAVLYERARALLKDRHQRVSDVAYALGYNDVANFSRAFKRWSGETPKQYRNGRH